MDQEITKPDKKTTAKHSLETVGKVRAMVRTLYTRAHEAKANGKLVAYCMIGCQYIEILQAMDILPIWTENYAGLCAAKRQAEPFLTKAASEGYSNDICSYVLTGIGFDAFRYELGEIPSLSPDGGMAQPDMLLGCSYICDPRYKWYQSLGRYMDTPIYNLDVVTPPVTADLDEVKDHYVEYQLEQFRGLVSFLENLTGRKLDKDRLWQHIRIADEIWQLWWECDQLRKAIPSPMPSEDHFNAMVPANFMDGTVEARDFYRELYDEIKYRVDNKIGVIPNEKYRLLWAGGIPPWHTMWMFNYFEERGAVFAIERCYRTYNPVEPPSGITDPLDYMAWRSFQRLAYDRDKRVSGNLIVDELLGMVKDYNISGMVTHVSRTCRAGSVGQLYQKAMIQDYVKVPALQLISDMVDVRDYSEYQWKMQIDAFLDTVDTCRRQLNTSY